MFLKKFSTCLTAGLTLSALLLVLGNSGTLAWFPPPLVFSLVGISLGSAVIFPFIWQRWERHPTHNADRIYAILFTVIRYSIAFNLASFGWKKVFGLQFIVPPDLAGEPMNLQSGETLVWYFFGYSHPFGLITALIQIIGSYFLLVRRTFLLSCLVLFTLMLNIALVDIFYHLNAGALIQAVILTLGLLFLLLTDKQKLVALFLKSDPAIPSITYKNKWLKNAARLSALTLSLLFVYYIVKA
ncbi:hypothetical protein [uncultured Fibrella sp.]|uniref:hypothetical protein n=1 Tax=uncultured Fibrella sp. TaxID=1284596 RepID=UPI0035CB70DC